MSLSPQIARVASHSQERTGCLVISLDFELYWGVRHEHWIEQYMPNLLGARKAIPLLLDLFTEFQIHATWATVGFLFCDGTKTLVNCAPSGQRPEYEKARLSPYRDLPLAEAVETDHSVFFAPSVIRLIAATPNQEIATHSFSHYYCAERGQNVETFKEDLRAAQRAAQLLGLTTTSIVFPKNQCVPAYLTACKEAGIVAYRGNAPSWLYRTATDEQQGYVRRLARLVDAYVPLTGRHCYPLPEASSGVPVNVPSSQFLRPYAPALKMLEFLRLRRITQDLAVAARRKRLYHLWWHPHNFGLRTENNVTFLRKILTHYRKLGASYGFKSLNMAELARRGASAQG